MHRNGAGLLISSTLLMLTFTGCITSSMREAPADGDVPDDIDAPPAETVDARPGTPDAKPVVQPDAAPPPTSGIRIIVEPDGKGDKELADAINTATKSLHMTMYILSSSKVQNALIARKNAGVDVKVVLDENLPSGSNTSDYNTLTGAGVAVHWAPAQFQYTHEKTFIIDGKEAWIMTMNAASSSPTDNREYLAVDDNAADIAEAETIFESDYAGTPVTSVTGPLVVSPLNSRAKILALIATAHTSIAIEAEEFSDSAITGALVNAGSAHVAITLVLSDETPSTAQNNSVTKIKGVGGKVVQLSTPTIHAKSLVVDGKSAYVGSENFTANSLDNNRELGVILSVATEVEKIATTTAADFAKGTPL